MLDAELFHSQTRTKHSAVALVTTTRILSLKNPWLITYTPYHSTNHRSPLTTPKHTLSSKEALHAFIIPRERNTPSILSPQPPCLQVSAHVKGLEVLRGNMDLACSLGLTALDSSLYRCDCGVNYKKKLSYECPSEILTKS